MRCNLIVDRASPSTDADLLTRFLLELGHTTMIVRGHATPPLAQVNFYLDSFDPWQLATAQHHVGIFNPRMPDAAWIPHLHHMTQIWARSTSAFAWFMHRGCDQAHFTGFLSRDPFDSSVQRERRVLCLTESAKNAAEVLAVYRNASATSDWLPALTLVSQHAPWHGPPGVAIHRAPPSCEVVDTWRNSHRFHLCLDEADWDHNIVEATACGGFVITIDACPAYDQVLPTFGHLITPMIKHGFVELLAPNDIPPGSISAALAKVASYSDATLDAMGERTRRWNLRRNEVFEHCARRLLQELAS